VIRGRLLDRPLEPMWMDAALRIALQTGSASEAKRLLELALRDAPLGDEARGKTVTALARVWIDPEPDCADMLRWAERELGDTSDLRGVHLVALIAVYPFFAEVCAFVGKTLALEGRVLTPDLRARLRATWGDRRTIHNAVQRAVKTLRAFGVLDGAPGSSLSEPGERLEIPATGIQWAAHAVLLARHAESIDERELRTGPELFIVAIESGTGNCITRVVRMTFNTTSGPTSFSPSVQ
jgi:hypothetical protein